MIKVDNIWKVRTYDDYKVYAKTTNLAIKKNVKESERLALIVSDMMKRTSRLS